jgi:hypothetical protein
VLDQGIGEAVLQEIELGRDGMHVVGRPDESLSAAVFYVGAFELKRRPIVAEAEWDRLRADAYPERFAKAAMKVLDSSAGCPRRTAGWFQVGSNPRQSVATRGQVTRSGKSRFTPGCIVVGIRGPLLVPT